MIKDLTKQKFGKLYVNGLSDKRLSKTKSNYWDCTCECGNHKIVVTQSLTSGRTKSCGCARKKRAANNKSVGDLSGLYWAHLRAAAKQRNIPLLISIDEAWLLFLQQNKKCAYTGRELTHYKYIKKDNGKDIYSEGTASLDRIDSNKPYILSNVQWVHKDINWLKNRFSQEDFLRLCKEVTDYRRL